MFYQDLHASSAEIVPVVGSGLTVDAGTASFAALIAALVASAEADGYSLPDPIADDFFDAADQIAEATSEHWLQTSVAAIFSKSSPVPTPALMALAKVRTGIIVTTNYDLAIEVAAAAVGRPVRTLTVRDIGAVLEPPGAGLRVLHLHGVCSDPDSIVLSSATYEKICNDEAAQLNLRVLATRHRLVFLGHNLDPREVHIRRDVDWAVTASAGAPAGHHVLITDRPTTTDHESQVFQADLESASQIRVAMFDDPRRSFEASKRAAFVISGPAQVQSPVPLLQPAQFLSHYVPLVVAPTKEVEESGSQVAYYATLFQRHPQRTIDLDDTISPLLLVAGGGIGKSEELRQIGLRSTRPALYQPLATWDVDGEWADPASKFVGVMASAQGVSADGAEIPHLTIDRLSDESFVLLLDGLDEVSETRRPRVVRLLNEVASQFPQHRFVVASRPLPPLDDLAGFTRFTPLPSGSWLVEYCLKRGFPVDRLEAALPESGSLEDLIIIPIFAAAAVDLVQAGETLPDTRIELVWDLTDRSVRQDSRTEVDPRQLQCWLDRIALLFELAETVEVPSAFLAESSMHVGLSAIVPDSDFITRLATRALLAEASGIVRFPVNVISEARAGRALLQSELGLDILRERVLLELAAIDGAGNRVRAIRQSWISTLELLLEAASPEWRACVAEFDRALAARGTPNGASQWERHNAIWTIWNVYLERRVWMSRGRESHGSGDNAALVRLLRIDVPTGFVDQVRNALGDANETVRGNALQLVPTLLSREEAIEVVRVAIVDTDPVVRRQAASAALELNAETLVEVMVQQALLDNDTSARETLLDFAIDLATDERAIEIVLDAPAGVRDHVVTSLVRKVPRSVLLKTLHDGESLPQVLLTTIVEDHGLFSSAPDWDASDVAALVDVLAVHSQGSGREDDVERILRVHPVVAIMTWLRHPPDPERSWQYRYLLLSVDDDDVEALIELLRNPTPELLSAAGMPEDSRPINEKARVEALEYITDVRTARATPAEDGSRKHATERVPRSRPTFETDDEHLQEVFADNGVAGAFNPATRMVSSNIVAQLEAGAERKAQLAPTQCAQLLRFLLNWGDDQRLVHWLASQWSDDALELVRAELETMSDETLCQIATTLPSPWPPSLAFRVLGALTGSDKSDDQKLLIAEVIQERVQAEHVREWAAENEAHWIDPLLAGMGDCNAELRLVARLGGATAGITRHPTGSTAGWLHHLRCRTTAEPLQSLIKSALTTGTSFHDADAVYRALNRCAGLEAPRLWDELINDESIPGGRFLYYSRREGVDKLAMEHAPRATTDPPVNDATLQSVVVNAVSPPS